MIKYKNIPVYYGRQIVSKYLFFFVFVFLCFISAKAQVISEIPCNNSIDTICIKNEIKNKYNTIQTGYSAYKKIDTTKFKHISIINILSVEVDTLNRQIEYKNNEDEIYFSFLSNINVLKDSVNLDFFTFKKNPKGHTLLSRIPSDMQDWVSLAILRTATQQLSLDCINLIYFFPEDRYYPQEAILYYKEISGKTHIIDYRQRHFRSLNEYLDFRFGSLQNYMETYKIRVNYTEQDLYIYD